MCIYHTGTRTEWVHVYSHVTRTCNLALSNPCGLLIVCLRHTHRTKSIRATRSTESENTLWDTLSLV